MKVTFQFSGFCNRSVRMFAGASGNRKRFFNIFSVQSKPDVLPWCFRRIIIYDMVSGKEGEYFSGFHFIFSAVPFEYSLSLLDGMYAEHRGSLLPLEVTAAFEKADVRYENIPDGLAVETGTHRIAVLFECVRIAPK